MEPEKLESIYDDPAWKQEQRLQALNSLTTRLWKLAGIIAAATILIFMGLRIQEGVNSFFQDFARLIFLYTLILLPAGIIALFLGVIPHRHYSFSSRVFFWVPVMIILLELAVIVISFSFSPYFT